MHPIAVALARLDVRDEAVPDESVDLGQRHPGLGAVVEQARLDPLRGLAEYREIGARTVVRRAQRVGLAGPDLHCRRGIIHQRDITGRPMREHHTQPPDPDQPEGDRVSTRPDLPSYGGMREEPARLGDLDACGPKVLDGLRRRLGRDAGGQFEQHPGGKSSLAASAAVAFTQ